MGSLTEQIQMPIKLQKTTATAVRPVTNTSTSTSVSPIGSPLLFVNPPLVAQIITSKVVPRMSLQKPSTNTHLFVPAKKTQTPWIMDRIDSDEVVHHYSRKIVRKYFDEGAEVIETSEESWDE